MGTKEWVKVTADGTICRRTVVELDADGRDAEWRQYDAQGTLVSRTQVSHREAHSGREIIRITELPPGTVSRIKVARYDEWDRLIELVTLAPDRAVQDRQVYEYSKDDRTVRYAKWGADGSVISDSTVELTGFPEGVKPCLAGNPLFYGPVKWLP